MRTTFSDIKASRIPESVNIPPTDARLLAYVNEATQRLMHKGRWWGTVQKYTMQATAGMITLPKQVASIEKVALARQPVPVRDFWYEFLDNGWGTRDITGSDSGQNEGLMQGRYPIFSDVVSPDKKLILQCDVATDIGKAVLVLGYDDNNNWIRTIQSGVVADGEVVLLAQTPGTTTVNNFAVITDLQVADDLDGQWWLYEYDTVTTLQRMIGHYQYDEVRPSYARYFFPSIGTTTTLVECLVKLEFVPMRQDTDYCLIGNLGALKKMCMAVKAEEENRYTDALALEQMAAQLLDAELDHYLGAGRTLGINIIGSSIGVNQPIETFM